ncbi:MAG: signal peptide peptidase SppA [Bradyrhizobium sp.]|nr:MAG: signal peptide peptidase SppA [Bradyrhizobium sp.]
MSSSAADYLVDRRRLGRQLRFWRIVAFVAVALFVLALAARWAGGLRLAGPHIARLTVSGFVSGNEESLKLIRDARDSSSAVAALIQIDSPGGTTEGSEEIYDELRLLAAKKPVAAVVGTMAASGAYIAALGTDRVFARGNSIVGSIGVLVEYPNVSGLMDKLGVKLESIKSSPLKAAPNGFEPTSDEAKAAMAALIADSFAWFKDLVKERRAMSDDELAKVDDGRVFTGRQGLPLKLIDAIGGEREAIAWLEADKGVAKGLPVRDYKPDARWGSLNLTSLAAATADGLGLSALASSLRHSNSETPVDGLVSVWQLSDEN